MVKPKQYYANIFMDRSGMFSHTPYALEEKLVREVSQGNAKEAVETLQEINRSGGKATLADDPLRSAKNSIICSCTILTRAAIRAGVQADEAFALSDAMIQHIEELDHRREVLKYEEEMLFQFIDLVTKRLIKNYSPIIEKAIHYIGSHLDGKILLADIAEFAGVHPAYLSSRFKQELQTPLTEYVAARKIQESTYFVQYTDYPFADIADLYGFSSQCYFQTVFKKIMGITPGEYRVGECRVGKYRVGEYRKKNTSIS
ncbi:hypothetical protein FACS189483_05490 [Spirochaetia bacterium]|nr:hypothetical protein FACS189483_05490 [Spirochaetia bacterium]